MRPLNKPQARFQPQSDTGKKFWDAVEKAKNTEQHEGVEVFRLTQEEANKCRFEIIDQNNRMAECTVHRDNFSHGVRLFPPHLWDIRNGILFKKVFGNWVAWIPVVSKNMERLKDA